MFCPSFVLQCLVSFLGFQSSKGEERASCFILIVFPVSFDF